MLEKATVTDTAGNAVDLDALTPVEDERRRAGHEGHDHEGHDHEGHDHA